MKASKIITAFLAAIIVLCCIPGLFKNSNEISEFELIDVIGLDSDKGISRLSLKPAQLKESDKAEPIVAEGYTFAAALDKAQTATSGRINASHANSFIVGGMSGEELKVACNFLSRDSDLQIDAYVYAARDCTAQELIKAMGKKGYDVTGVKKYTEAYGGSSISITDLAAAMLSENGCAVLPALSLTGDDASPVSPNGSAVYGGEFLGYLTEQQTQYYSLLTGGEFSQIITVRVQEEKISAEVFSADVKTAFSEDGSKIYISVKADCAIQQSPLHLTDKQLESVSEGVSRRLTEGITDIVEVQKRYDADFLELSKQLAMQQPFDGDKAEAQRRVLSAEYEVEADVTILSGTDVQLGA